MSHGRVPYRRDLHLIGVYLTGVHLMGVYLISVCLMDVYLWVTVRLRLPGCKLRTLNNDLELSEEAT